MEARIDLVKRDALPEWPGLVKAMSGVMQAGRQDGREHMIALAPNGREIFRVSGDAHSVAIPFPFNFLDGLLKGALIVHNHPILVGLSVLDLAVAQTQRASIMAVMPDGGWDYAGKVETLDPFAGMMMNDALADAENLVGRLNGQTWDMAQVWAPGNLLPMLAAYDLGIVQDWKHSYSDRFWENAQKFVPEIKRGVFHVRED